MTKSSDMAHVDRECRELQTLCLSLAGFFSSVAEVDRKASEPTTICRGGEEEGEKGRGKRVLSLSLFKESRTWNKQKKKGERG